MSHFALPFRIGDHGSLLQMDLFQYLLFSSLNESRGCDIHPLEETIWLIQLTWPLWRVPLIVIPMESALSPAENKACISVWNLCIHPLVWTIWFEQNRQVFEDISIHIEDLSLFCLRVLGVWAKYCMQFRFFSIESCVQKSIIHSSPSRDWSWFTFDFVSWIFSSSIKKQVFR